MDIAKAAIYGGDDTRVYDARLLWQSCDRVFTRFFVKSKFFINPLMALYWSFRLDGVAHRNLYLDQIRNTETADEVSLAIEKFRDALPKTRPWTTIPC